MKTQITPFKINVPQSQLNDLKDRLNKTIWPGEVENAGWKYGPAQDYVKNLVEEWRTTYDWRKWEAVLNRLPQYTTEIDGQTIHFIHVRSANKNATPLMLVHGWPGSVVEFLDVIELLTNPPSQNGGTGAAFDLVIPSLPGYGFSGPTREAGWKDVRIAKALIELMTRLGYERFGVQGGDAGAVICPEIARLAPKRVVGVHVNAATLGFIPLRPLDPSEVANLTAAEQVRLQRLQKFMAECFGFNMIQSHRPQALAYALADSPTGLLTWISELFTGFGASIDAVAREKLLTNATIYWVTGTIASSMGHYYENAHDPSAWAPKANSGVPTAVAVFQEGDVAIRKFSEDGNTIVRWTEYEKGGHFAAMEMPEILAADVRAFFETCRV